MSKEKIKKTNEENTKQKIKAIYPHIVVSGDIDKPCYNIHWYDIEQKTMIYGFGSYKLEFVRKWLEEEFEVVEEDIDNFIKSQEAEIESLKQVDVIKEFVEKLKDILATEVTVEYEIADGFFKDFFDITETFNEIDNLAKKWGVIQSDK